MSGQLNLRTSIVEKYFSNKSKNFSDFFKWIEKHEFWTVDESADVIHSLDELTRILNQDVKAEDIINNEENLFIIMAYIKLSKSLRLLNFFDEKYKKENISETLIKIANNKKELSTHRLMLERLMVIKDFSMLNKIYSDERLDRVDNILKKIKIENKE